MEKRKGKIAVVSLFAMCTMVLIVFCGVKNREFVEAQTLQGVVTADTLNVRSGPGVDYGLVQVDGKNVYLFKNDKVSILADAGSFYKVKFTYNKVSVTGYSSKYYISLVADTTVDIEEGQVPNGAPTTATPAPTSSTKTVSGLSYKGKVNTTSLRVRTKASTTSPQLTYEKKKVSLKKDKTVTVKKQKFVKGVVWYYVSFKYKDTTLKGYVLSDYVTLNLTDVKVKGKIYSGSKVVVRNKAGVNSDYLKYKDAAVKLSNGKSVTIKKEAVANSKKWFQVSFKYKDVSLKGYVLANKVEYKPATTTTPQPTVTTTPEVGTGGGIASGPALEGTEKPEQTVPPVVTPNVTETPKVTAQPTHTMVPNTSTAGNSGVVISELPLNVRVGAGTDKDKLLYNGEVVQLSMGTQVTIWSETVIYNKNNQKEEWYYISFTYKNELMYGYVLSGNGNTTYVAMNSAG